MSMIRFKITYAGRAFEPWELHELITPDGWFRRRWWQRIEYANTKEALERRITQIVEGESKFRPTYYTNAGTLDYSW